MKKYIKTKIFLSLIIVSFLSMSLTSIARGEPEYVEAIILLDEGMNCDELEGVEVLEHCESVKLYRVKMSRFTFNQMENLPCVKKISENYDTKLMLLGQDTLPAGVDDINAELIWGGTENDADITPGRPSGNGVKVAVIDYGIKTDHPDLAQNYAGGYDYKDEDSDPMETREYPYNHGTKCAGVIAALDNDVSQSIIGMAPEVQLYALRTDLSHWQIAQSIDWCIANNIDVISMSFGANPLGLLNWVIEEALFRAYICNIILVASSGNYPQLPVEDWVYYPACSGWTLAVGAYNPYWREGGRIEISDGYTWSSCYGTQLSVLAPGFRCRTTDHSLDGYDSLFQGTSCAAPHVAGVAALMRAANPSISVGDVYGIISSTADDIGPSGKDLENGYGIVNAYEAVMLAEAIPPTVDIFAPSYNYQRVSGSYQIKATASDDFGILTSVEVSINNEPWHACTPISNYWTWAWDTTPYPEGNHRIRCRATDLAGNTDIDQIYAKVDNIPDGGGGGGCPILYVYDGNDLLCEGLLDIHNPDEVDVILDHELVNNPPSIDNRYHLKLIEHQKTFSFIDKIELWGITSNGRRIKLLLLSAVHSELNQVKRKLRFSDEKKVVLLGEDYNEGVSQSIDLEFLAPKRLHFSRYIFTIEGHNYIVK